MKKFTQSLNSPKKIAAFVIAVILIAGAVGFATLQVGANVNANKTIGLDRGVAVALADAGFTAEEVTNLTAHYDSENGVAAYEVDFMANGFEYDYTIKASDGKIIEAQREKAPGKTTADTANNNTAKSTDKTSGTAGNTSNTAGKTSNTAGNTTDANSYATPTQPQQSSNGTSSAANPVSNYIGVDKAKSIALKDAGVSSSSAVFTKAKLDRDDGMMVYEVEFYSGDTEYEYEINATSGKIRSRDAEFREYDYDWDYDGYYDEWDD